MPKQRTSVSKIKDILRLKFDCHLPNRSIAACLNVGCGTISEIVTRFKGSDLVWPLSDAVTDSQLESQLYAGRQPAALKRPPDFADCHHELKRKGMTRLLLWQEYQQQEPGTAYGYTQFCVLYQEWLKKQKRSMRQLHVAGEKLFLDFCGPTVPVVNPDTGVIRHAQIFVATLGASSYTYIEACESQSKESWLMAHVRAFEFFGGVPRLLVPDNLKAAVKQADRYEPVVNDSYLKLARHYNTAVMPARPWKPKDKAKVENAVQIVERWVLMRLRRQVFHTFTSLNQALAGLLKELNERAFRLYPGNRRSRFEQLDQPALMALPRQRYDYTETGRAKVGPDYHILWRRHAYSVPHVLVGAHIDLEAGAKVIRLYHRGQLVAQHPRNFTESGFSTLTEHMPESHQQQRWSPERLLDWGANIGSATRTVVAWHLQQRKHPEQAYRSCLGLLSLARKYGDGRLENACRQALLLEKPHRQVIVNLLDNRRDEIPAAPAEDETPIQHGNVRGAGYYH
jgi:transposase